MSPVHILLVEDNEGDIFLIKEAMEASRIVNTISVVKDGSKVLPFLQKEGRFLNVASPDLILLDLNLPRKNGLEVLEQIKNNDQFKTIPVIMLTTSSADTDVSQSYQRHVNCYITKPVDADTFLKVVTSIENFWISIVKLPKT